MGKRVCIFHDLLQIVIPFDHDNPFWRFIPSIDGPSELIAMMSLLIHVSFKIVWILPRSLHVVLRFGKFGADEGFEAVKVWTTWSAILGLSRNGSKPTIAYMSLSGSNVDLVRFWLNWYILSDQMFNGLVLEESLTALYKKVI